jgi:anti-sigma regulatory factor (Ser/Thr protein kinase)
VVGIGLRVQAEATNAVVVRTALKVWLSGLPASAEQAFAILLAVNEAFANAVEHPREPTSATVHIAAHYDQGIVEITVRDHGVWRNEARDGHRSAGLLLMAAFMDSVNVHSDHLGTVVMLSQRLEPPYERASSDALAAGSLVQSNH